GAAAEIASTFAASSEKNQIAGDNFGHIFFLSAGLIVPGAGLQAAFDIDLAALLQIFSGDLRQPLPEHNVVPLGAVLPLAALVLETLVGGNGNFCHSCAAGRVFNFRVLAKIADELNSIKTFACHDRRSFCLFQTQLTPKETIPKMV